MIESKLQKKLRWAMLQVSLVTLVLLVCGGLLFSHLQILQKDAVRANRWLRKRRNTNRASSSS